MTDLDLALYDIREKADQFSQELQLLYEGDSLSGVLGFYYLDASAFTAFDVALFTTLNGLTAQTLGDVETKTWSVFGDFTYDLSGLINVQPREGRSVAELSTYELLHPTEALMAETKSNRATFLHDGHMRFSEPLLATVAAMIFFMDGSPFCYFG